MFGGKCFLKVKNDGYKTHLLIPFIKRLMPNVTEKLQMNITLSQKYYFGIA